MSVLKGRKEQLRVEPVDVKPSLGGGQRRTRLKFGAMLGTVLIAGVGCGAAGVTQSVHTPGDTGTASATVTSEATTSNDSSSSSWLAVGSQISANRVTLQSEVASGATFSYSTFGPYLSAPITINQPGTYTILAGPLLAADTGALPHQISFPPDVPQYFTYTSSDPSQAQVVTQDGAQYVEITLDVETVTAPYVGLRIWFA
jgi:hypothetical protein